MNGVVKGDQSDNTEIGPSKDRPLLTFALFAYNQEKYIREAIDGAFSQTYSPLEIILSDDCSSDSTFDIMLEMAEKYDGPHKVILNQNSPNLGWCGHINKVMSIVKSDWVIIAAGDDVSLPQRTDETIKAICLNPDANSIYFNTDYIRNDVSNQTIFVPDLKTHDLIEMVKSGGAKVLGPSHAWNMRTFSVFGAMPADAVSEDRVIPFRSALLGEIAFVDKKVVRYRLHDASISTTGNKSSDYLDYREYRLRQVKRLRGTFASFVRDLSVAGNKRLIESKECKELYNLTCYQIVQLERYITSWEGKYFERVVAALRILISPSKFTGASHYQRFFILCNAVFPFIDPLYHYLVRNRRHV